MKSLAFSLAALASLILFPVFGGAARAQSALGPLSGHVPAAVAGLKPAGRLDGTNRLRLIVGLPLRHQDALGQLLTNLYDPASPSFRQWLSADEFSARFGPTEDDYRQVHDYLAASGLKITGVCSNRMLVDVEAPVADIERVFHLTLRLYPHPAEARNFYAPDVEPSVPTNLPILHINGLDNYEQVHRLGSLKYTRYDASNGVTPYYTGSAPGGYFMGNDFRAAYVPGVTNTGAGQYVGIVDVGGQYYTNDIYQYELAAGLSTSTAVTNVIATDTSYWTTPLTGSSTDDGEEALDICMAMSMAPGAVILNYEGAGDDVFNRIASDNQAKQLTLSYGFGIDPNTIQSFEQFLAQGQAMSQASGDGDSDLNGGTGLTGNPFATIVGGTTLATSGAGGPWSSETTWNWGGNTGSGGGISGYGIPAWQTGAATAFNQGSTNYRNYPDVAMPADGVYLISKNDTSVGWVGGTSCASPLWAGFMALVNQQAATLGKPAVGFPNPAIYALGKGSYQSYTNCFHDINTGNNANSQNPARYYATNGYDLCTGWGTPRGSNTIAELAGIGTNNFAIYTSQGALTLVPGGNATVTATLARMNGFAGAVSLSVGGMPVGMSAAFAVVMVTNDIVTLAAAKTTAPGNYTVNLTASSGGLSRTAPVSLTIAAPIPGATLVSLANYNRDGIWTDYRTFSGGLDGDGYCYSANLLGAAVSWNGMVYTLGSSNAADCLDCAGQTIALPAGKFNSLQLLGAGVNGSQSGNITVTYTDGTTATFTQSFSDWASPQSYAGESTVVSMAYRGASGGPDFFTPVRLYGYSFTLDQTRTAKSVTLPNDGDIVLLAMSLANEPASAPLAAYYNRYGIYSDGVTFTNPATGGADGGGSAYSANLLTGNQSWSNVLFNFGPANTTNVISGAGQTISLPAGGYNSLRLLASAVQGAQTGKIFTVKYTDGATASFTQSLSDWYTPANYVGESKAIIMGHRNTSGGVADNRTFYLYGYAFALNSAKTVQSLTLPNDSDVIIAAISLVPEWQPTFNQNPITEPSIAAGQTFSGSIAANASDLNGDPLTFALASGPDWLAVAANGALSGMPASANVGLNTFTVSATDPGGLTTNATVYITVTAAPPIYSSVAGLNPPTLSWTGGVPPYQVQTCTNLTQNAWSTFFGPTNATSVPISATNPAAYYRVVGN